MSVDALRGAPRLRLLVIALALLSITLQRAEAYPAAPAPESTAVIAVQTPGPNTNGCATTRVEIWAKDITGLYGIDVRVTFDPNMLQVADADPNADGVQITPLSNFLKPDFVVKKLACNSASATNPDCASAGVVWYAVTQTSPTPPATGSGALAAIDFVGANPGLSSLQIVYSEPVDVHGNPIPANTANAQLNAVPPASPAVRAGLPASGTVRLSWDAIPGAAYRVYRDTRPYFAPVEPPYASTTLPTYDDVGAAGDADVNRFYVVKAGCGASLLSAGSNRTGEFDYRLTKP